MCVNRHITVPGRCRWWIHVHVLTCCVNIGWIYITWSYLGKRELKIFTSTRSFETNHKETMQEGQRQNAWVEVSGRHGDYNGDSFNDPKRP